MSYEAERGKAIAAQIREELLTDMRAIDSDFAAMVRRAATGDAAGLAEYLISGRPIEAGERRELALLLLGEMGRAASRPAKSHALKAEAVAAFDAEMAKPGAVRKQALADVGARFGTSRSMLEEYLREARERAEVIAEQERLYRQSE
jgi:hypothetical protein